ncbi:4'-phosphopantetheinyl transferase superfamily protein [Streptomyces sp. 796.1]|uniref:4'-phosphopantetheinyl transferase superfamily protein n=1 Tax=Streptomyces sp. 796.1 TaxID=3163029 RepID=UPI0039C8F77D
MRARTADAATAGAASADGTTANGTTADARTADATIARLFTGPAVRVARAAVGELPFAALPAAVRAGLPGFAAARRRGTYTAGRLAAARATAALTGAAHWPLPGERGAPHWPHGVSGSLTHTDELAVCVVTADPRFAVGLDVEPLTSAAGLYAARRYACTPAELARVEAEPHPELAVLRLFSAKEALYKALPAADQEGLTFRSVTLHWGEAGRCAGECCRPGERRGTGASCGAGEGCGTGCRTSACRRTEAPGSGASHRTGACRCAPERRQLGDCCGAAGCPCAGGPTLLTVCPGDPAPALLRGARVRCHVLDGHLVSAVSLVVTPAVAGSAEEAQTAPHGTAVAPSHPPYATTAPPTTA